MELRVDKNLCTGHGRCHAEAPDLFPIDENGFTSVEHMNVVAGREGEVNRAVAACPEQAIFVEG